MSWGGGGGELRTYHLSDGRSKEFLYCGRKFAPESKMLEIFHEKMRFSQNENTFIQRNEECLFSCTSSLLLEFDDYNWKEQAKLEFHSVCVKNL